MITSSEHSLSDLFKALAHPVRVAILSVLIQDGDSCVCHLEARLHQRQAYLSQQLAVLREAGLLEVQRDGWNVYYHLARPDVVELLRLGATLVDRSLPETSTNATCSCPKCAQKVHFTNLEEK
jgi:ArsR family transcriptional regulator